MRRRLLAACAALAATFSLVGAHADVPDAPTVPLNRSTEPVVLTGAQFPDLSAGPEFALHEPQSPTNSGTVNQWGTLAGTPFESECYRAPNTDPNGVHPNPYDYSDNGDHNCYQPNRLAPLNDGREGADISHILGYRWDPSANLGSGGFVEIPFQIDEKFTRLITNNVSGFAFYSGVDQETSYAWDREGFRYTSDDFVLSGGDPCHARPAPGSPMVDSVTFGSAAAMADPIKGLDDNDEIAFMYGDAGNAAPTGARPAGASKAYDVAVADPTNPAALKHVYLTLSPSDTASFTAANGYVRYQRDANADRFAFSRSGSYGVAPSGPYCNADGTIATSASGKPAHGITVDSSDPVVKSWAIATRRPLDGAWVKTPGYWFRYDGRWLMTQLRISPDGTGLSDTPNLGPDIIDQWKARAFQQRPGGKTPCCGYEEEVNNWGGSSILFGEKAGPVRAIRAAWGADSSTNNIKTEIFYRDEIRFQDNLRVHVIPPFDGIYVQWDYSAGKVATYYNPWKPNGVPADGQNDEVFGNTRVHVGPDGATFYDGDPMPGNPNGLNIGTPGAGNDQQNCKFSSSLGSEDGVCNDLDFADPTFSGPAGNLNWEEVAGPNGTVVTRWTVKQHTAGDSYSLIAQPYYRDDSCFDDGTGNEPGPHLKLRAVDTGTGNGFAGDASTYLDPATNTYVPRVCWKPSDGDPYDTSVGDGRPRKFWQGDVATHGLHLQLIAESDNAQVAEPIDEIDSEQRMVVLAPTAANQLNVGEQYGRSADEPLQVVITPV